MFASDDDLFQSPMLQNMLVQVFNETLREQFAAFGAPNVPQSVVDEHIATAFSLTSIFRENDIEKAKHCLDYIPANHNALAVAGAGTFGVLAERGFRAAVSSPADQVMSAFGAYVLCIIDSAFRCKV